MQALNKNELIDEILPMAIKSLLLNTESSKTFFYDAMETIFELGIIELPSECLFCLEYVYENLIKHSEYPFLFKEKYKNLIYQNIVLHLFKDEKDIEANISLTSTYFENLI